MNNQAFQTFSWDFSTADAFSWQADFADYPPGQEAFYRLGADVRSRPFNLGGDQALFITGDNRSDDLFMYFRQFVTGLAPNTRYHVTFDLELASNAPADSFGIGGSPATSVYLKAGATQVEPLPNLVDPDEDFLRLNIDKGNQSQVGRDAVLLGDLAKPIGDDSWDYSLIRRDNQANPFRFKTDDSGSAWLYFGTDSGFEGTTALYYTEFSATFASHVAVPESSAIAFLLLAGAWIGWARKVKC
ncbi:MAG: hypothetical protein ACTS2F_28950 [Thainema sp.]